MYEMVDVAHTTKSGPKGRARKSREASLLLEGLRSSRTAEFLEPIPELDPVNMRVVENVHPGRAVDGPVHVGEGNVHLIGPALAFEEERRAAAGAESAASLRS